MISVEKRRQLRVFLLLLLGSAIVMLLLSTSSPLYPTNPWVDPNCFVTVARGMREGLLPYRDLIEQKGPLLYALHVPAVMISPNGFFGVYLLEVLACAFFLFAAWKTVRLYEERGTLVPLLIGMAALLASSLAFVYGDSAEELCTPLLAWSLYDALRYFRGNDRMTAGCLLRNGLLAGCVLWIKYSLLGLHFAWMAVVAIDSVVRERKIGPAVKMCAVFLGGMALSCLPWLVYFGANGALGDLIRVYFTQNITEYKTSDSLIVTLAKGLGGGAVQNPFTFLLIAAGGVCVLLDKGGVRRKVCLIAMFACTSLLVYFGGRLYRYTYYAFTAFAPLGLILVLRLLERLRKRRAATGLLAACMCVVALVSCPMLPKIGTNADELVQTRFAREINRKEDATLINYGFLDGGFYLAADVHPNQPWFVTLNNSKEKGMAAQARVIEVGDVDFVVAQGKTLEERGVDAGQYELILRERDTYSKPRDQEDYFLYRKKGLEIR